MSGQRAISILSQGLVVFPETSPSAKIVEKSLALIDVVC